MVRSSSARLLHVPWTLMEETYFLCLDNFLKTLCGTEVSLSLCLHSNLHGPPEIINMANHYSSYQTSQLTLMVSTGWLKIKPAQPTSWVSTGVVYIFLRQCDLPRRLLCQCSVIYTRKSLTCKPACNKSFHIFAHREWLSTTSTFLKKVYIYADRGRV